MIELNKTQKSVLKVLKDTYKKDTVTINGDKCSCKKE